MRLTARSYVSVHSETHGHGSGVPVIPAPRTRRLLCWHECRSALVLDQDHQEFGRLRTACVPVNDMNIGGAFIEALSRCQGYLFSTLHLHHDGAFQYLDHRMRIVSV